MKITDPKSAFAGWHDVEVPWVPGDIAFERRRVRVGGIQPEIKAWLVENIGEYGRGGWISSTGRRGRVFSIRNADKALLFKLTWAGRSNAS